MEGVMAVVTCFAVDWAPKNWALCNGQILSIAQNQALFSLLGTTFGGNGVTTFGLPNLQSRTPVSSGQGPGLSNYTLGEMTGAETITLTASNVPPHLHDGAVNLYLDADSSDGGVQQAVDAYPAVLSNAYFPTPTAGTAMTAPTYTNSAIGANAGGQPFAARMPYLGVNYIICMYGIYPSRN
jgi:microcystin-dependent protein